MRPSLEAVTASMVPLVNFLSGSGVEEDVNRAVQALAVVVGTLGATGILATAALGTSCEDAVEWEGVLYISPGTVRESPERGASLGSGEIPDCEAGGRCSPPGESVQVFRLEDVDPSVAVATNTGVYLAPGTFPALPDHPLHEAVFGSSSNPNYRKRCGEPFGFVGEVRQGAGFSLRVDPNDPPDQLLEFVEDEGVWVEVDADTVVEGFDRNGVATIEDGTPVEVTVRMCEGEPSGPFADRIRPRSETARD